MASIFTFDPNPPRVASPWTNSGTSTPELPGTLATEASRHTEHIGRDGSLARSFDVAGSPLSKLEAEPQDGPTEYKLHLLLRPRRSFCSATTGGRVPGSIRSSPLGDVGRRPPSGPLSQTPPLSSSSQSRQHRLEQLTTQLLWRLQQSSPYHASASRNLVPPSLPRAVGAIGAPGLPEKALPGLEESRGALYELGVADDGTFVGLAQDELDESLHNLRAMAATLGCSVELLRKVAVGECEWLDETASPNGPSAKPMKDTLWVAEAFIKPNFGEPSLSIDATRTSKVSPGIPTPPAPAAHVTVSVGDTDRSSTEQLRVTLTGATMSGKSSLLGSLSSSTLDNGRGKSRLNLLKHRHEIASGMTSSVTQELVGYCTQGPLSSGPLPVRVVNYAAEDVASWPDIHDLCQSGRLVFLSDSAGHPRYRRTTVRGLVGWAPHWTLLCVPADVAEDTAGLSGSTPPLKDLLGCGTAEVDLSEAYLQICLELRLPLVIAITKLDLASKTGLRQLLARLLTSLKAAGRKPVLLRDSPGASFDPEDLQVASGDLLDARRALSQATPSTTVVPVVCTSAVNGIGISKLHALLHELPVPRLDADVNVTHKLDELSAKTLFHVEDVFGDKPGVGGDSDLVVISGILRHGALKVGESLMLGPFQAGHLTGGSGVSRSLIPLDRPFMPRSFPGALKSVDSLSQGSLVDREEWKRVKIVSLRNLRLPVRSLRADQVGTAGLRLDEAFGSTDVGALSRARKGMVLSRIPRSSCSIVEAEFPGVDIRALSVGSLVMVYIASVRASAKVILISVGHDAEPEPSPEIEEGAFDFELDGYAESSASAKVPETGRPTTIVHLRFTSSREYVERGAQVLVLPGGGRGLTSSNARGERGLAGLDGFVGTVISEEDRERQ